MLNEQALETGRLAGEERGQDGRFDRNAFVEATIILERDAVVPTPVEQEIHICRVCDRRQNLLCLSSRIQCDVGQIVPVNAAHYQLHIDPKSEVIVLCSAIAGAGKRRGSTSPVWTFGAGNFCMRKFILCLHIHFDQLCILLAVSSNISLS